MDKANASRPSLTTGAETPVPTRRTCLYIEDSYSNLLLVEQLIARRGDVKLLSANTGPLGIQMAKDFHPDIIFMDINLPGMSGVEALVILLANPATSDIPVTALSSNAYPNQIEEGLRKGFFRYLTKPFKLEDFATAVDDMLLHVAIIP